MPMQSGITSRTPDRMIFDAGAIYRNYDEAGEAVIGATRGGATFTIERDDREIEVDGTRGPTMGLRRTVTHFARLEVVLIEISRQTLVDLLRGTVTSDGTHHVIQPNNSIVDADYYANISLVADVSGTSTPCVLKILNALMMGGATITTDDKNEGELAVTIEGHYDFDNVDDPPYEISWPATAS